MKLNSVVLCSIAALVAASPTPKRRRDADASNAAPIPDASLDSQDTAEAALPSVQELTEMWEKGVREAQSTTPEMDLSFLLPTPENTGVNRHIPPSAESAPSMESAPAEPGAPTVQEFAAMWEKAVREAQASRPDLDLSSLLPAPHNMMLRRNIPPSAESAPSMESAPAEAGAPTVQEFAAMWEKAVREAQASRPDLDLSSLIPVPEDFKVKRSIPPAADAPNVEQAPAEAAMPSAQAVQELTEMWEKAIKEAKDRGMLPTDEFDVERIPAEEFEENWNQIVARWDAEAVPADPPKKSSSSTKPKAGSGMSSSTSGHSHGDSSSSSESGHGHSHGGSSGEPAAAEEPAAEEPAAETAPVEEAPEVEEAPKPKSKGKGMRSGSKGCSNKAKNDVCADKIIGAGELGKGGLGMLGGLPSGGLGSLGSGSGLGSLGMGSV